MARALAAIERRQGRRQNAADTKNDDQLQAALVALDPATGDVRAMVGGRDFARSQYNRVTQARRQPGSAFKPLVYPTALEHGYSAATTISGLGEPIATVHGAWVPEDEHGDVDAMTMRTALRMSSNRAAVRMLQDVGIPETLRYARRLGLGPLPGVPSLALGSGEVTLLSMTRAFAAFANSGVVTTPTLIRRVESADGGLLYEATRDEARALSATTAFILTSMLADVVDAGTGWQARQVGFTKPAAGKNGHDRRFSRCLVRRLHAAPGGRSVDRLRPAAHNHGQRLRCPTGGAAVGTLHGRGGEGRSAKPVRAVGHRRAAAHLPSQRHGRTRRLQPCRRHRRWREPHARVDGLYGVFCSRHGTCGALPLHTPWSFSALVVRGARTPVPTAPPATPTTRGRTAPSASQAGSPSLGALASGPEEEARPRKSGSWSRLFRALVQK